ncbi:monovalent cation/H(+) antiporter subunit G [Salisaeta longa]|uniref:monovalent cation/H(+) antiporter subunit G n=1 Tax=Salisaeta longa TaxID=503170 RepID=UPI0003B6EABF|nr:monovalent cation/H(+) antiporter subunit G [Salisaeta longa]
MTDLVAALLMIGGTLFMLIAVVGLLRLPDLYTRMHAISKAGTVGVGLLLIGLTVHFSHFSFTTRAVAVILFILLTAPVSSHLIGRAAYLSGIALWDRSRFDQWEASLENVPHESVVDESAVERAAPDDAPEA